ncbi:MAG: ATP-dependent DNA helicase RecQ [Rhodothermales bacterium]
MVDQGQKTAALALLKQYWGYDDFRAGQWDIIDNVLQNRDVLAILPTGGGKSICYQIPALMSEGVTLVISPLIALMQDQVQRLEQLGIKATFINSTLKPGQIDQRWTDIEHGRFKLVYIAPERLKSEMFQARVERLNIDLVAIDEAHCISEWGYDFRPAYLEIAEIRSILPDVPLVALTATATPPVRDDILGHLDLKKPYVLINGFNRPNLTWSIFQVENKRRKVSDVLRGVKGTGIIYAATRHSVEQWQEWLQRQGETASGYHGGMSGADRESSAKDWLKGKTRVMVATNAFGMGIDKPDVRFVIHVDLPAALESYYQEAGRAGRDGDRAHAILLYRAGDEETQQGLIKESHPDQAKIQHIYDLICQEERIALGDQPEQPIVIHLKDIAYKTQSGIGGVRVAIDEIAKEEYWHVVRGKHHATQVRFLQSAGSIRAYMRQVKNEKVVRFVETLLRTVQADAFADWWEIDLRILERKMNLPRNRILDGFAFLKSRELMTWVQPGSQQKLIFARPRAKKLSLNAGARKQAKKRAVVRLKDMLRYTFSVTCRRHFLLKFFGENSPGNCGSCDICLGRHEAVVITPEDEPLLRQILKYIRDDVPRGGWFEEHTVGNQVRLPGLLSWLNQEAYIESLNPLEDTYRITEKAGLLLKDWEPLSASADDEGK